MKHVLQSPAFPDVVREWATDRSPKKPHGHGFAARVAALFVKFQSDRLLDAIRVP